jgi:hypothetical protein
MNTFDIVCVVITLWNVVGAIMFVPSSYFDNKPLRKKVMWIALGGPTCWLVDGLLLLSDIYIVSSIRKRINIWSNK